MLLKTEKAKKLVSDLDRIIREENFDVETLFCAFNNWTSYFKVQRDLLHQQKWEEVDRMGEQMNVYVDQVKDMVYPIYLKMLDLGYPSAMLTHGQL